jgi:Asp-tRNA(Asn)/Glu-tRNA(Gln) amidotransferase A subunit family amidase
MPSRRRFLAASAALGASALVPAPLARSADLPEPRPLPPPDPTLTTGDLACAERVQGLAFSDRDRERMLPDVEARLDRFAALRAQDVPNDLPPALTLDLSLAGETRPAPGPGASFTPDPSTPRPRTDEDLAFASVAELAGMLRGGRVTSVELTRLALDRLRRLDPTLLAVVSLTEERALAQAARMNAELASGRDRGPLHGIPYGAKDLLSVAGYPTTWGTEPYREQAFEEDAAVIDRMDAAGAVLVAKLTLGELAWGDVWFGGMTRSPWNPEVGASGSSAGSASAVAAGAVPFAIGSETYGSIVSPSTRNGVTGFRPTFGRVSTRGAMALSWSMDKLGPITRSALDAALVFDALRGPDPRDREAPVDPAFPFDPASDLSALRVGVLEGGFDGEGEGADADRATLAALDRLGVRTRPVALPDDVPADALLIILEAEAAAAFDGLTRAGGLDLMSRQERYSWPNVFRHARHIPAVEYLTANRLRTRLMRRMAEVMQDLDVLVLPSFGNAGLAITNLTGHPAVAIPNAFLPANGSEAYREPRTITFLGPLWGDHHPLRLAHAVQGETNHHRLRPPVH